MLQSVLVRDVMIPLPLTIDVEQTLAAARARMLQLEVRHLPVMSNGRLVGMLSERDVNLAAGLGMRLEEVSVGIAMSPGPFTVSPNEPLQVIVRVMAERKLGSAVVVQNERVVGVFTSTDGLHLLSHILKHTEAFGPIRLSPNIALERLQKEQAVLSSIKEAARATAVAALSEDEAALEELPRCSQGLDQAVLRYLELEQELLLPLLAQQSPDGAIRAELLREHHQQKRRQIHMARVAMLNTADPEHLASAILNMCEV